MNSPKVAANPQIAQNTVQAYCLAVLSDAACFEKYCDVVDCVVG